MNQKFAFAALCSTLAVSALAAPMYNLVDLGTLDGSSSAAGGMNSSGQVVGYYETAGGSRIFEYTPGTGMISLTTPGRDATAAGINDMGQVIGSFYDADGRHVFVYTPGVGISDLSPAIFPLDVTYFTGINNSGQIVGNMLNGFVYSTAAGITGLPNLGGPSFPKAINDAGQIVGASGRNVEHAFLYRPGVGITDLGTLGGPQSQAYSISRNGLVTGYAQLSNETAHAFLYSPSSGVSDLGALFREGTSAGFSVNSLGQVVGNATGPDGLYRAIFYSSNTGMLDLNTLIDPSLGWMLGGAIAINDRGMITGNGNVGGKDHAFLLTPASTPPPNVPEPGTGLITGSAVLCAAAVWVTRTHIRKSHSIV